MNSIKYFTLFQRDSYEGYADSCVVNSIKGIGLWHNQHISYFLEGNLIVLNDKIFNNIEDIKNHFDHHELYVELINYE